MTERANERLRIKNSLAENTNLSDLIQFSGEFRDVNDSDDSDDEHNDNQENVEF